MEAKFQYEEGGGPGGGGGGESGISMRGCRGEMLGTGQFEGRGAINDGYTYEEVGVDEVIENKALRARMALNGIALDSAILNIVRSLLSFQNRVRKTKKVLEIIDRKTQSRT